MAHDTTPATTLVRKVRMSIRNPPFCCQIGGGNRESIPYLAGKENSNVIVGIPLKKMWKTSFFCVPRCYNELNFNKIFLGTKNHSVKARRKKS